MKVLEIILLILIIIIIYPGIGYLKKASDKASRQFGDTPPSFTGSTYYKPKTIWSGNTKEEYKYNGTCVIGSGICKVYTYEQALISQKTDSNGNFNLLSNVSYVRPNLNTALQDFVEGNSHLTGKVSDIDSGSDGKCIDPDQINTQYVSKVCLESTAEGSLNKCFDNQGNIIDGGDVFSYNSDCSKSLCQGEVGCISLNYSSASGAISINTMCISIEGISIPQKLDTTFDLDFYNSMGIINVDNTVNVNGPYPVKFRFSPCNNTDARQKFKILRFSGKGTSGSGVCVNKNQTLKYDDQGSYASLIFRGLDSYLGASTNGKFYLYPFNEGTSIADTVKWVFFPETQLTGLTVPSTQRCAHFASNFYTDAGVAQAIDTKISATPGAGYIGLERAKSAAWGGVGGVGRLAQGTGNLVRKGINAFGQGSRGVDPNEASQNPAYDPEGAEGDAAEGEGDDMLDWLAEQGAKSAVNVGAENISDDFAMAIARGAVNAGSAAARAAAKAGAYVSRAAASAKGAVADALEGAGERIAETAVGRAAISIGSALAGEISELLSGVGELLGPLLILQMILSIVFAFAPDPSYCQNNPFYVAGAYSLGMKVSPTNFGSDILALSNPGASGGNFGLAPLKKMEDYCIPRKLDNYPPYYLEAVTDGTTASLELINYDFATAYHISGRKVLSFGTAPNAYGLWIWNKANNLKLSSLSDGSLWKDYETTWLVRSPLSEAVMFPKNYFTESKESSVAVPKRGTATADLPYSIKTASTSTVWNSPLYRKSKAGLIDKLNITAKKTKKQLNNTTRFAGVYLDIDKPRGLIYPSTALDSASFNVIVSNVPNTPTESVTQVTSFSIYNPGSGFKKGDNITIPYTAIGGTSPGASISFDVSTVRDEFFIFKAAYRYTDLKSKKDVYALPGTTLLQDKYGFESGGFEIQAPYNGYSADAFTPSETGPVGAPTLVISGGTGYGVGETLYLIQYDAFTDTPTSTAYLIPPARTPEFDGQVNISVCLELTIKSLSESGFTSDREAPGNLLDSGMQINNFDLEYNLMDNATNFYNPCPQQIVFGGEKNDKGEDLISYLSTKIKGKLTPKAVQAVFLGDDKKDKGTGMLYTDRDKTLMTLKSMQVDTLGYDYVDMRDIGTIQQTKINDSKVVLKKFIPYFSFAPAYYDDDQKQKMAEEKTEQFLFAVANILEPELSFLLNAPRLDIPTLKYGISTYFYNQNYAQIIPYGVPDVYNNSKFIDNAPMF